MKVENSGRFPSTRFQILGNEERIARAKKSYFICITIAILFVCLTAVYFSYKAFAPTYFEAENPLISNKYTTDRPKDAELRFYSPKPLLIGFRRKTSKDKWELTCEESQPRSEAVPALLIQDILEKNVENIQNYVNFNLLLYYENLINTNGAVSLKEIFNEYQLKLSSVKTSGDFVNFLKVLKSNEFKFYANFLKKSLNLKNFETFFALTYEFNHWYNYLDRLDVFLSSYERQKNGDYFVNCTRENFENFTEDTQKLLFHFSYPFNITEKKLWEVNEVINKWTKPVNIIYDNTSVIFHNKVLLLSKLNAEIRGLNLSCVKSVFFLASHTLFLDDDLEFLGVNLAIISPKWMFLKKIKINLNGVNGENTTHDADYGHLGKPGNPGGNAGDFLGIGNPHEKFLLVTANGGEGGNGQNGAKGQDGANNTRPGPPVNKPSCMTKENVFKNSFGQIITHYKIYSAAGCGTSGTNGGIGGEGGAGGVITLINENSVKVKKGLKGGSGSPGKGGPGGLGGQNGCFYEVLDVDDEILHRVTRVKCLHGNVLPSGEFGKDNHNTQGLVFPPVKKNLTLHEGINQFIQFTGGDFIPGTISLLKQLNQVQVNSPRDVKDIALEYKSLQTFDRIEFYDVLIEKIDINLRPSSAQPILTFLKPILLGRMIILKENINYFFIDFRNYLNVVKSDIKTTNQNTRQFQSSIYLKRKAKDKLEEMIQNLKEIKSRCDAAPFGNNQIKCIMMMTTTVLLSLVDKNPNSNQPELEALFKSCLLNLNPDIVPQKTLTETSLTNGAKDMFKILKNIASQEDVRGHMEKLKEALYIAKDADVLSEEERNLLGALTDEVEHFIALYYFIDWERLENLFFKSLHDLTSNKDLELESEAEFLKAHLVDVMLGVQYSLAVNAARQNLHPFNDRTTRLNFFQNKPLLEDVLSRITLLEDNSSQGTDSFCKNHLKAVFDKNSAVGEFYFWPNANIRNKLKMLFSGAEIDLKADLINRHVLEKNFVQFTSLKLELECSRNGSVCQELNLVLDNFKMEITHSGYSYYNWKGETRVVVSDKVSMDYSFRMRDKNEPEIYNALYKKCQDGEIKLSPFTTWTVRLLPINDEADYKNLLSFTDVVNIRLTGSGTYIS